MTALAAIILWAGCVGWSLASAVDFAATSREDVVAVRQAHAETRHGWQATVRRSEKKTYVTPNVTTSECDLG